ncbi:MAG: hypothetical protein HKN91_06305 [Acidimicrobiia bacterium]|nr:hypothetical protein [Acidimicrobiia bacterium]
MRKVAAMATPTQTVTRNVQKYLGDEFEVVMAVRVEWGADAARRSKNRGYGLFAHVWTPLVNPILATVRARGAQRALREDPASGVGVLALTADGRRILLSAMPWRPKTLTGIVEQLPRNAALLPNLDLMQTDVVPTLTVDRYEFVVDRVDFKALLKAVETGVIDAPKIRADLARLSAVGWNRYRP